MNGILMHKTYIGWREVSCFVFVFLQNPSKVIKTKVYCNDQGLLMSIEPRAQIKAFIKKKFHEMKINVI